MPTLLHRVRHALFGYDAIDTKNRRKAPTPLVRSEDDELDELGRRKIVGGNRDIFRNYTVCKWMVNKHLDYVADFTFRAKTENKALNRQLEDLVTRRWAARENFDVARRHGLYRALRLAEARRTLDGDLLLVRQTSGQVQLIEGDRLREGMNMPESIDRTRLVHGVLLDDAGAARQYCVCRRGARGFAQLTGESTFQFERLVPAANSYLHGYFDRLDQVRGVGPVTTAMNELRDSYEALDLARAKLKVESLFALAIYRQIADGDEIPAVERDEAGRYKVDFGRGPIKLELDPGDKAEFLQSNNPSTQTQTFLQLVIQIALKALDLPYSYFSEDFTNYSGARQAAINYERSAKHKRRDNQELLNWLTEWRLLLYQLDGELPGVDLSTVRYEWTPIGMPWIDPLKEVLATKNAIGMGLMSRTDWCLQQGKDFEDVVSELAHEAKLLRAAGLPLSLDADQATIAALLKEDPAAGQPADAGDDLAANAAAAPAAGGSQTQLPDQGGVHSDQTLNGAQIEAAVLVMQQLAGGTLAAVAAVELLVAVGIPRDRAQVMVSEQAKVELPQAPPSVPEPETVAA